MTDFLQFDSERRRSLFISVALFALGVGGMAYLRLYLFRDRFITLTYGLPLLVCLWHRDRTLLWCMAASFAGMAYYKAFHVLPDADPGDFYEMLQWSFQVVNLCVIAGAVHGIIHFTDALRLKNIALANANEELNAQAEELAQQNEEIHTQSEELAQANEELNQQTEELQQQNEELESQSEELQAQAQILNSTNEDLTDRETMLARVLKTVALNDHQRPVLEEICDMVLSIFGRSAQCAVVVEKENENLQVRAYCGLDSLERDRWSMRNSLAAVAMEHGRTAGVHDLRARPDLIVPQAPGIEMRASLATPLRIGGEITGVVEVHSTEPHAWTAREFQLLEWASSQCGLLLEVTRLRDELAEKNEGLEKVVTERTAKLQELINELEHFSYTITHDMRAPLRALQGFAGILVQECEVKLNAEEKDYLGRIVQSAERMDRLITDALSYSRAVRQEQPLDRVDTERLLKGIIESYPLFHPPSAVIEIEGSLPPVLANEAGLTQVLSNLLSNAVKFTSDTDKPRVMIRAETNDGLVRLWVEDNGIGIPEEFVPRLFGMFQRCDKRYDGTGVGLALVRKVCERMGGRVGVNSRLGQGSKFWIELKAAPALFKQAEKIETLGI